MRLKFGGKIISENDLIIFLRWPFLAPCFYVVQLFLAVVHEYVKKVGEGHQYVVVLHVIVFFSHFNAKKISCGHKYNRSRDLNIAHTHTHNICII